MTQLAIMSPTIHATQQQIQQCLKALSSDNLKDGARYLLNTLGYASEKRVDLTPNIATTFVEAFDLQQRLNCKDALLAEWRSVDLLFQLTNEEVTQPMRGRFASSSGAVDNTISESYLFFAIELTGAQYTRRQLAGITREVNKLFPMPVMLLFRHGERLTLSIINRRLGIREESQDVLERVTLIKDILLTEPIRAHIEVLHDLSLSVLLEGCRFHNFVGLHRAWEKRLNIYQLNERFYREIANWFFWTLQHPGFVPPRDATTTAQRSSFVIRLITRLIFCWFLQEKELIPRDLFRPQVVAQMLKNYANDSGTYYKAVLQNLYFATFNQAREQRGFWTPSQNEGCPGDRGMTMCYRYRDAFHDPDAFVEMLKQVPIINGGLFGCLDHVFQTTEKKTNVRLHDFSGDTDNMLCLPNELFFGQEREVDLSEVDQDKRRKKARVRGLIETLNRYRFTVEENTPLEQEIALDPDLLGKVCENLLASYDGEARTTARKATGSFYTPREIVKYMVDETLVAHLATQMAAHGEQPHLETKLRALLTTSVSDFQNSFSQNEMDALVAAIDRVKILDPACGSGAFLMGMLHRLVELLRKLDPNNYRWKAQQLERACSDRMRAERMTDEVDRENAIQDIKARLVDIDQSFDNRFHELDFARKLYLIEHCIYGVDIQPIACQVAMMRLLITLIADQKVEPRAPNFGMRPLPNLETKVAAADALMPIEKLQITNDFDIVIGNPPYVRIQTLQQQRPAYAVFLKANYIATSKGNFDLYVAFVERGLELLQGEGNLAYILPHKFFTAQYGQPLRALLSKGTHLSQIIHFGDQQVFPGTMNYVCLLFLRKTGVENFRFVKVDDLSGWLKTTQGMTTQISAKKVTAAEWNFVVGKGAGLFEKLTQMSTKLGQIAELFVGLQTDADDVFIVERVREQGDHLICRSTFTAEEHPFEAGHLKPLLKGSHNIHRYRLVDDTKQLIFPYKTKHRASELIPAKDYAVRFPLTWNYLRTCQHRLKVRAKGKLGERWYGYVYRKNHPRFEQPKLVVPSIATGSRFAADLEGRYYLVGSGGGGGGGYGVILKPEAPLSLTCLLGVLNSSIQSYYLRQISTSFRGGYYALNRQYIKQLPIPAISASQETMINHLVSYLLWLHRYAAVTRKFVEHAGGLPMINYFDQLLSSLVYELFFPDELHAKQLFLFRYVEEERLPTLAEIPETKALAILHEIFERMCDLNHPIRACLLSLGALETVRIIEGED